MDIVRKLGLSRKRVDRWIKLETLPPRNAIAPSAASPSLYVDHLTRRWKEGCTMATKLLVELKELGYTGSYVHLARFIASWRRKIEIGETKNPIPTPEQLPRDPATGRPLSPLTAGALCIKPRTQLTQRQAAIVNTLKKASSEFATMRRLAMRFRGILRSGSLGKLEQWRDDARQSGIYAMQRFAKSLARDLEAVQNAITQP